MSYEHDRELYAVPGHHNIIDTINPETGLTRFCGETFEQVRARYPLAVRMTWEAWTAAASAAQRTPIAWTETTAAQYDDMLNVLPPIDWNGRAFMVGEPTDHDVMNGQPRYVAYWRRGDRHFESSRPLTRAELRDELRKIRADTCPYCHGPYTLAAGGCVTRCTIGESLKHIIRDAAEYNERRDPREGEP